tara:strand:- start:16 stop:264 length:249 start_codon:yes stop_codon:yes gene_type:complete
MSEAWDSTCERCGFHYFNAEGDGPMRQSDNQGSQGWKTLPELEDDVQEGFAFLGPAFISMLTNGWEVICGECVDGICEEESE